MIDQLEHFLVEHPVRVISAAVTKFKDVYFFSLFVLLIYRRAIF